MAGKKKSQTARPKKKTASGKKGKDRGTESGSQVRVNPPPNGSPERGDGDHSKG
jgi:hypothetical protein